jgi:uncharacterized protein YndB with AHSA1/START domain
MLSLYYVPAAEALTPMTKSSDSDQRFEQTITIGASPAKVFDCFFSPDALRAWWQVERSVTTPVPFGVYAVEWRTAANRDDVLGPLGGIFHGIVVDARPGRKFAVAECWWVPPEGNPLGPMALDVTCAPDGDGCKLRIRQSGYEPSVRWQRYYATAAKAWQSALPALKQFAETGSVDG